MYLRFESEEPSVERTVECRAYEVRVGSDGQKSIRLDDQENPEWVLSEKEGHWKTVYVMNEDGRTIETIRACARVA